MLPQVMWSWALVNPPSVLSKPATPRRPPAVQSCHGKAGLAVSPHLHVPSGTDGHTKRAKRILQRQRTKKRDRVLGQQGLWSHLLSSQHLTCQCSFFLLLQTLRTRLFPNSKHSSQPQCSGPQGHPLPLIFLQPTRQCLKRTRSTKPCLGALRGC